MGRMSTGPRRVAGRIIARVIHFSFSPHFDDNTIMADFSLSPPKVLKTKDLGTPAPVRARDPWDHRGLASV